jgi:HK97 family phage major capsid protein
MPYGDSIGSNDVGALIPEEVASSIISGIEITSAAMRLMRRARMSRAQQRLPVLSALPTAYFVAGGGGLKQTTKMAWANKYLVAEEIAVIVPIPEAYLDDAEFDIWGEVKPKIAEAFAVAIDAAVLFGTNKPDTWGDDVYTHAVTAGNAVVRGAVGGQDVAGDVSDTMALVENDGFDVNGHVARRSMRATFRNLRDDNGQPIFTPGLTAKDPATLWGEPLQYISNAAWDATNASLMTGDWNQAIFATRQDITYKMLTEASIHDEDGALVYNFAQQDMVGLRCVGRFAYQVANAINREGTYSGQSPFGVLHPTGWVA